MNEQGDWNGWFVPVRTMPWQGCEGCDGREDFRGLFQTEGDANGALVCFECASEFGSVRGIDG